MSVILRAALPADAAELTRVAFASKKYWNYPESYFDEVWTRELTLTEDYIAKAEITVAESNGAVAGFCSLLFAEEHKSGETLVEAGLYLDHMFIDPPFIGKGIGSLLLRGALARAKELGAPRLRLFSDPHAKGFYEKMGASFVCDAPSSIPGRTIPVMEFGIG